MFVDIFIVSEVFLKIIFALDLVKIPAAKPVLDGRWDIGHQFRTLSPQLGWHSECIGMVAVEHDGAR